MANDKLQLSENHRRVVSVLMRGIDRMCSDIEAYFKDSGGVLEGVSDDLSLTEKNQLRRMIADVRQEIGRIASEVTLDTSVLSVRRKIYALISANIVNLEESEPRKLLGYGALSDAAMKHLQDEFGLFLRLLEKMASILEAP